MLAAPVVRIVANMLSASSTRWMAKFVAFAGVGVVGTAAHYVTLLALVESMGVPAAVASGIGATVGAAVNYALNYRITFRSTAAHVTTLPRFVVVALLGVVVSAGVVAVAQRLELHYFAGQIAATALVLLVGFFLNSIWTFSEAVNGSSRKS
jgi:putative flippase GtrA